MRDDEDVRAALRLWRDSLVDLTGTSRLLHLPPATAAVEITSPPPDDLVAALRRGDECAFEGTGPVRPLLKRARQEYLDRGVSTLHLAAGLLHWRDDQDGAHVSPILLVPVTVAGTGPGETPRLAARDEDPVLNPALVLRLRELGVEPPALAEDLPRLWSAFGAAVGGRAGWRVSPAAVLSCLTFHKEAMYRDLLDNEARIIAHPVVRALAATDHRDRTDAFDFTPIGPREIDALAPPEDVPLVLDADASQRSCVAAAMAGHSFVLDGPPGTGKSQTIANMIAGLLYAGRRVLFVSEKAAALEVVRHRLDGVGLGTYLLELHSHQAGRKEVAAALATAAEHVAELPLAPAPADHGRLRERREQLTAYAEAMNEVRGPAGLRLHDALGVCADLVEAPEAPPPAIEPGALTADVLRRVDDAAERLARAWRATDAGFVWRDVRERAPLDAAVARAQQALGRLAAAARRNAATAAAFDLHRPSDAAKLAALVAHAAGRPPEARDDWLTAPSLRPAREALAGLARGLAAVRHAREAVRARSGVAWTALPAVAELPELPAELESLTADAADNLARRYAEDANRWERHRQSVDRITARLEVPGIATFPDLDRVAAIAELGGRPHRPEPFWFGAGVLATVSAGAVTLRRCLEALVAVEVRARPYFSEAILGQPVDQLADRFTNTHRGFRKLLGAYRRDRRAVAAFVLPTADAAEAAARLGIAVSWQRARRDLAAAEQSYAMVLGRHWQGVATDFRALEEAIRVAAEALRWTPPAIVPAVARYVCAEEADAELIRLAASAREDFRRWQPGHPRLAAGGVDDAVGRLRANVEPLAAAARLVRAFGAAVGHDLDVAETVRLCGLRQAAADAEAALTAEAAQFAVLLGEGTTTPAADEKALAAAIEWAAAARRLATGTDRPLAAEQAQALRRSRADAALPELVAGWEQGRRALLDAFEPGRLAGLDDYDSTAGLLRELRADTTGQEEWSDHLAAREELAGHGLDAVVEFCVEHGVEAEEVRPVVRRALYRSWCDAVIRADTRLRPRPAADRDHLVAEFRRLDSRRVATAPAEVLARLDARRPPESAETSLLHREAMKVTGHLPVRELLAQARGTVQALKPCFLMSPLAVSQYLPPDLRFDVVIFDEASQVTPADAIACVYRAGAFIAAGDDKQLPPTSFFDHAVPPAGDEEAGTGVRDFQSVLELAKACGSFRHLGLTWHYRSAHESLIAFANQAFYAGRLTTFPSADGEGPDTGIEIFRVRGVYRRSAGRDNPIEAELVAERVVRHFATRPDRSLGVVTFSVAQAEAIERAVERAGLFTEDDRLHGFFVKSLESVQGDERDVMIFSIGYGFDDAGKISANFGPLNRPNGWRRLNVAITRARHRVEIVTSIRARDIPESDNEGVRRLAAYLDFAERGGTAPAAPPRACADPADCPFEESVLATIRSWGYAVRSGVGASRRRVDLAVRHPAYRGEVFAIGIQCDGAGYHASAAARDRDRLHDQMLRSLGWQLHRIWSTAWHHDRAAEEERLRVAIVRAVALPVGGRPPRPLPEPPATRVIEALTR